jgi:uncharacterized protein (DUF433 family)
MFHVGGEAVLVGLVSNDRRFPNGRLIITSRVVEIDEAAGLARTLNTTYELAEEMDGRDLLESGAPADPIKKAAPQELAVGQPCDDVIAAIEAAEHGVEPPEISSGEPVEKPGPLLLVDVDWAADLIAEMTAIAEGGDSSASDDEIDENEAARRAQLPVVLFKRHAEGRALPSRKRDGDVRPWYRVADVEKLAEWMGGMREVGCELAAVTEELIQMLAARVTVDPEIMGGRPCVSSTRVPVATVVAELRAGKSQTEICRHYPSLPWDGIAAVTAWADRVLGPEWRKGATPRDDFMRDGLLALAAEIKREARAAGLTDEEVDVELAAYNAERRE